VIRAVIDTNVLVSGLLSQKGNEALVILAIHHGFLRPCFSEAIVQEYAAVLARPKFRFPAEDIAALLGVITGKGERFNPGIFTIVSPDDADTKFLHCALEAGADFIVTGNRRDFPDGPYGTAHVVNAGELLERITQDI